MGRPSSAIRASYDARKTAEKARRAAKRQRGELICFKCKSRPVAKQWDEFDMCRDCFLSSDLWYTLTRYVVYTPLISTLQL